MTIVSDMLSRLGSGAWGTTKSAMGFGNPAVLGYQVGSMSYPFTKDAVHPGAAEARAGHGASMRNAYRDQFNEDRDRLGIPQLAGAPSVVPQPQGAPQQPPAPSPMAQALQSGGATPQGPMPNGSTMDSPQPARVMIQQGPAAPPPPMTEAMGQVPMPQPRPQEPPQQDISWFLRNAYNQRDPNSGASIDPEMAQKYEAKNPFAGLFGS